MSPLVVSAVFEATLSKVKIDQLLVIFIQSLFQEFLALFFKREKFSIFTVFLINKKDNREVVLNLKTKMSVIEVEIEQSKEFYKLLEALRNFAELRESGEPCWAVVQALPLQKGAGGA